MVSKAEKNRKKKARACVHDYIFLDKWQDAQRVYWEFACRWCLDIMIRSEPLAFLKTGRKE